MPWEVTAICDGCGKRSEMAQRRSFLAAVLKRKGWLKGKPGQMFCSECGWHLTTARAHKPHWAETQIDPAILKGD